jgi:hypothetical protein
VLVSKISPTARHLVAVVVWTSLLAATCLLYSTAVDIGGTVPEALCLHPVLFGVTAWPVIWAALCGRPLFSIRNSVLVLIYVYTGLGLIHFILYYNDIDSESLRNPALVGTATLIVLLGTLAYRFGADLPWTRPLVQRLPHLPSTPHYHGIIRLTVALALCSGVLAQVLQMKYGSFGFGAPIDETGINSLLDQLRLVGYLGLTAAVYYRYAIRPRRFLDTVVLGLAMAVYLALAVVHGMKEAVIEVAIFAGLPYITCGQRLRVSSVIAGVLALAFLFGLNPYYREALVDLTPRESRAALLTEAYELTSRHPTKRSNVVLDGLERVWDRTAIFNYMLPVLQNVPDRYPFRKWDRYPLMITNALVPRYLWREKPLNLEGLAFTETFIVSLSYSTTPLVFGWAYLEDGLVGVMILLFILGLLAGGLQEYSLRRHGMSLVGVLIFAISFRCLFQIEADPYSVMNLLIKRFVVLGGAYTLLFYLPSKMQPHPKRKDDGMLVNALRRRA